MKDNFDRKDLEAALETLRKGGTIVYPTDTIWGIGGDATNAEVVSRIYQIKKRDDRKSMIILLENENQLQSYVQNVPDIAYDLIEFSERPLTIVFDGAKNLPANLVGEDSTIGIRIVKHPFCKALIQKFRKPIVSTSANLSGNPSPAKFDDIDGEILDQADYTVQFGQDSAEEGRPSVIMRLANDGSFEFLRK